MKKNTDSILLYSKRGCPFCNKLKDLLKEEKITYIEIDVIADPAGALGAVHREGRIPVPQVEYNGTIIFEYTTEEALVETTKQLLKKSRLD
ncbi:glutaredoxin [Candidatus Pacearchaeota archaeon]|nr:glutaredoxin [Candidatus Pacearchaeota archaeon]